jgi:hypothetical protein
LVFPDDFEHSENHVFDVPLEHQQALLDATLVHGRDHLVNFIYAHWPTIRLEARLRHTDGYRDYGSRMYSWSADERRQNVVEELADALVYLSSGPYSDFGGKLE